MKLVSPAFRQVLSDQPEEAVQTSAAVTAIWPAPLPGLCPIPYDPCVARVVVSAKLKPGRHEEAAELLRAGPQYDPAEIGLVRHGVYLASSEVIFLFEGPDIENRLRDLLNDRAVSASFAAWGPLLEGTPSAAHELFYWEAASAEGAADDAY